jgi:ABC-type nitrate/sulfonate/bicarbonate transport system substrate-binding protein
MRTIAFAALAFGVAAPAHALDKIRFGKAFPGLFQFTPVDLGIEKGYFSKRGLEVEIKESITMSR